MISLLTPSAWIPEGDGSHATSRGPRFSTRAPVSFLSVVANPGHLNTAYDLAHFQRRPLSCLDTWWYPRRRPPKDRPCAIRELSGSFPPPCPYSLVVFQTKCLIFAETILAEMTLRCGGGGWVVGGRVGGGGVCGGVVPQTHITHISCFAHILPVLHT